MPKTPSQTKIKALVEAQFPGAWAILKPTECRALAFAQLGDAEGFIAWGAIGRAAVKLLKDGPPDDVSG
jgi:hypothetical protein